MCAAPVSVQFARLLLLWSLGWGLAGCIDPYMPETISSARSYLVVDGNINPRGVTTIQLSRTFDIDARGLPPAETRATVTMEDEAGTRYPLPESTTRGTYTSASLLLTPGRNYRLRILTTTGKEYASDFVPALLTPDIDNVVWQATTSGLTIYVNTHDDTNRTKYYRWEYEETWELKSHYSPVIEYVSGQIRDIVTPYPTLCWGNLKSADIKLSNTTRLTQDVVFNFPIRSLSTTANQLRYRYSILVKQRAQTAAEYLHWEQLQRNTEKIGTLFDPLPSQLTGNVQCLNDDTELALGYVGAHTVLEKRLFINRAELPNNWRVQNGYEACIPADTIGTSSQALQGAFGNPNYLPINPILNMRAIVIGYLGQSRDCIDCRTRGTSVRPSFW